MNFYYCESCQQISFHIVDKDHHITCCDEEMRLLIPNEDKEEHKDHHINLRKVGNFLSITIGDAHQMIDVHHIEFIVLETNQGMQIKKISDMAQASFILDHLEDIISVYAYCNLHGLFKLSL